MILNRKKRLILCIYNNLLFSLTLFQDSSSWPPLCHYYFYIYLLGTNERGGQRPIKRPVAQSTFCSATQWRTGAFHRMLLFRSLYTYLLRTRYALGDEEAAGNKAGTVSALTKLMVHWEKWAINRKPNKSGPVGAVIGIPREGGFLWDACQGET